MVGWGHGPVYYTERHCWGSSGCWKMLRHCLQHSALHSYTGCSTNLHALGLSFFSLLCVVSNVCGCQSKSENEITNKIMWIPEGAKVKHANVENLLHIHVYVYMYTRMHGHGQEQHSMDGLQSASLERTPGPRKSQVYLTHTCPQISLYILYAG